MKPSPTGQKRDRSPPIPLAPDTPAVKSKKCKGDHVSVPTSSQAEKIDMKLSELPVTPGDIVFNPQVYPAKHIEVSDMTDIKVNPLPQTSKHPRPGSSLKGDRVPPLWAQESCTLLQTICQELRELKKEVLHVKEKLNTVNKPELYEIRVRLSRFNGK